MAFSIRSFFGKEKASDPLAQGGESPGNQGGTLPPLGANPFQSAPAQPFAANSPFKAADPTSAPMNSPFTPFTPAASGRTELTVGDILPGLPPEAANTRQVSPSQPLHLADEVVDRALASGHAALPLFEIYRVCPALFQTPISPEDKRTVPIPPHKIASLIPVKGNPAAALPGAGASPFAVASPATVPGFGGGAPTSLFSPFVQAEPPAGEPSDSTTLFHPSPFGFGPAASEPPPRPEQSPAAMSSPFGLAQPSPGPEAGQGSLAPGVPNPFAPSSAATFSAMAFGAPAPAPVPAPAPTPASAPGPLGGSSPFSFGAPAAPPPTYPAAPPPASAPELPATPSPFAPALPEAVRPVPFDFATPASSVDSSPFAPAAAPQTPSNPLWAGGSPFAPTSPTPGPAAPLHSPFAPEARPPVSPPAQVMSPFNAPAEIPPPAPATPSSAAAVVPPWMATPVKPGMGASPFAGFTVPPPAQPAPLAPLPPEDPSAASAAFDAPSPEEIPSAGMPSFPGFSPFPAADAPAQPLVPPSDMWQRPTATPSQPFAGINGQAEPAPQPIQPAPFSPAPEVSRPAQPPASMNPFERIQALSRSETAPAPAPAASSEERAAPPAPVTNPIPEGFSAAAAAASASPFAPFTSSIQPPSPVSEPAAPAFTPPAFTPPAPAPVAAPTPAPVPAPASVFAPAPEIRSSTHPVERVTLSLASVLKGCKTQDIGMSPDHIPSWVRVSLPLDLIRPQLLSGKVTLRVTQVMAALEPELRNLITPSRPDLSVDLPMSELRKALPNEPFPELATPAPEAAPQQPAPLFKAFTPPPMTAAPSNAPDLVFGTPTTPPPFFQAAPPPVELSSPSPADSAWPLQPGTPEPEPAPVAEPAELASAFSFLKDEPEITAAAAPDDTVIDITAATEEPVQSAAEVTPPQAQAPAPPAPPQPPSEPTGITKAAIRVINPAPASQSASQMVLRALLNTDEPLDASAVMQLMACQPGIVAVVCLRDGICLASAGNGGAEAEHFLNQAPKLHHHVKPLIELTGAHDTETFSMNSGPFVITFSLQSDVTLGVLHDPRTQGPALRERVILIARELTPLLAPPAA